MTIQPISNENGMLLCCYLLRLKFHYFISFHLYISELRIISLNRGYCTEQLNLEDDVSAGENMDQHTNVFDGEGFAADVDFLDERVLNIETTYPFWLAYWYWFGT